MISLSERRANLTDTSGARQPLKEKDHGTAHHQNPSRRPELHRAHPRVLAHESLVCITLDANRVGATLRVDLPTREGGLRYARTVAEYLAHDASAASVLFAVYTSEPQKPGQPKPHSATIAVLTCALAERGMTIRDGLLVGDNTVSPDAVDDRVKAIHRMNPGEAPEQARTLWDGMPQREQMPPRH